MSFCHSPSNHRSQLNLNELNPIYFFLLVVVRLKYPVSNELEEPGVGPMTRWESLTGTLGEPSGGIPVADGTMAAWVASGSLDNHETLPWIPGFGVDSFSSFGMASESYFSSPSPAIGAVSGK